MYYGVLGSAKLMARSEAEKEQVVTGADQPLYQMARYFGPLRSYGSSSA